MKKTDQVRCDLTRWVGRVTGISGGNVSLRWVTGPLTGRDARRPKEGLRVVTKGAG